MEAESGKNDPLLTASHEQLLRYLEDASGKALRTHEDIDAFLQENSRRDPIHNPVTQTLLKAKQSVWLLLLVSAFLQYHLIDVMVEVASLRSVAFTVPPAMHNAERSRT